jgi:hypothetical protein
VSYELAEWLENDHVFPNKTADSDGLTGIETVQFKRETER